ncbi:serine phosphatase RsbU (regulator of sigma subunit) [Actinoplanes lutulentus]|nr:serine phosphatase RsbU (regulator of sigma subunit) [Actinoplanes lutulentus]
MLYTDGVVDAPGEPRGEPFGQSRLVTLLTEYAGRPAALIAERIGQRTGDWSDSADQDDLAVLIITARPLPEA